MKLAIIYPEKLPSKFARSVSVINTARELAKHVDTTLIYEKSFSKREIEKFYKINLGKLHLLPISKKMLVTSNKIFNFNLKKFLKYFDIFYVRHLKQAEFLIKNNKKVIYECHEVFSDQNQKIKKVEKFVMEKANGLIFHNKTTQKIVNKKYNLTQNQAVIYNAHNFLNNEYIKKDFSTLNNITYIGSFIPWKGVDFLIKCLNDSDFQLNIIGDGSKKEYLKSIANKNIKFLGFKTKDEIESILKRNVLCIIPNKKSRYSLYSTPIKLFEYMAFGNIVIAPNFEPIKEIIKDGYNGFLYEGEDCSSLKKVLEEINNISISKLEEISYNAYLTSKDYTYNKRAKKIIKFINEVFEKN